MDEDVISFGPYRLLAAQRLLLEGDKPVRLGSRAFDILIALIERAGHVVSKEELIARVWPSTYVEEANLKIQVSALRRVLGDGQGDNRYVATVVGRGYNFVAPLRKDRPLRPSLSTATAPEALHNLPFATTRMIGREEIAAALVAQLSQQRLVTVVGPGGIGKTTVGLAVAERMIGAYEHGVWLTDLAPLSDPGLVPSAVATVLGLEIRTKDRLFGLVAALKERRALLLLDNCEHVIDAAADLAAAVLRGTQGVSILATSREPLGIQGERVHRLGPLNSPEPLAGLTAREAAASPAVQLFVERATAIVEDFALTDANAASVVAVCQRLDGLPLAIEFVAPRVEVLGVEGLAACLNDRIRLSGTRRRAALPRHRTMQAVVDWSYGLLSQDEQRFFRALGIFAGGFTVDAAAAVAVDVATAAVDTIGHLADLVAKSLVAADVGGAKPRFRLLDTTRAYALEKLDENGERDAIAYRHAEYYRDFFEHAENAVAARPSDGWLIDSAREIDNIRAALDWCFSPAGHSSIGVTLTNAAFPLWMRLSLLEECRGRALQALRAFSTDGSQNPREQMQLHAALGASTSNPSEMSEALTKTLEIARSIGDIEYQLRALRGLYFHHAVNSLYRAALPLAQAFHDLATSESNSNDRPFGERMIGVAKHFIGDQAGARPHLEQVLSDYPRAEPGRGNVPFKDIVRFGTDLRVSAHVFLARVLWLQGFPDQAVRTAEIAIEEALATVHAQSLCYALTLASCQVALWTGNLGAAERHTGMLLEYSRKHSLPVWGELGSRLQSVVELKSNNVSARLRLPPVGHDRIHSRSFNFMVLLGELSDALAYAGRTDEALRLVDQAIDMPEEDWLTPELFRLKGELVLAQGATGAAETAEHLFRRAQHSARRQEALSWELRAATSLARLLRKQGYLDNAAAVLQPVYSRFTEGFETADLVTAKKLLDDLGVAVTRLAHGSGCLSRP